MVKFIEQLLSIPKSFYICYRLTRSIRKSLSFPLFVRFNTRIISLHGGNLEFTKGCGLRLGFGSNGLYDKSINRTALQINGTLTLRGVSTFRSGSKICIMKEGNLVLGNRVDNSADCSIVCAKSITIEDDVTISWHTTIIDTDMHNTMNLSTGKHIEMTKPIIIQKNAWICMHTIVLKGTTIAQGVILAAGSIARGHLERPNSIYAGSPAVFKKEGFTLVK